MLASAAAQITVVMHCFSMPDRLEECLAARLVRVLRGQRHVPLGRGPARGRRARAGRAAAGRDRRAVPGPQPIRGRSNEPAAVVHTARALAAARGVSYEELEQQVERNAAAVFGW